MSFAGTVILTRDGVSLTRISGALSAKSKKARMLLEESANRNVFVQVGPMNADAAADQPPVLSFLGRSRLENGKPVEGDADFSPIFESNAELFLGKEDVNGPRLRCLMSRSMHPNGP